MALETLTRQNADRVGQALVVNAVTIAGGFEFPNDGHTVLIVTNDALDCELVFTIQKTLDGQSVTRTVDVTASETWIIGPFPVELYNDADGYVFCTPEQDFTGTTEGISVTSF
jgi:hypothetical protein